MKRARKTIAAAEARESGTAGKGGTNPGKEEPTAWKLFLLFAGISSITIGGGYAIVPVIGVALEKRGWIGEEDFQNLFARAQAFPGPIALSTAILSSRKLIGARGVFPAVAGVVLPPFAALVLVGSLLGQFGENPVLKRFLHGAGATVPGLVAAMLWRTGRKRKWTPLRAFATIALALALGLAPGMSLPILLGAIALLYAAERTWKS
jgi:chromate transporter